MNPFGDRTCALVATLINVACCFSSKRGGRAAPVNVINIIVVLIILCLLFCTIMRHACCFVCLDDKKGLQELGIDISPNVLSLSTLDNNTTTFSLSLPDTVVVSLFLYRSTTSFVSIPNNHSLLRISTWCRNA
jgi:hypothetical protein